MSNTNNPNNPDWSGITTGVTSTEEITGGSGAGGGTGTQQTYTVEKGDTLSGISKTVYGSANHWKEIFEANRDQLDDPDVIQPGQVLNIPARAE